MNEKRDELIGALIGMARAADGNWFLTADSSWEVMRGGLLATTDQLEDWIEKVRAEKFRMVPNCASCAAPCGRTSEYDMKKLWEADEEIRQIKTVLLLSIRGLAVLAEEADEDLRKFFFRVMFILGEDWSKDELQQVLLEFDQQFRGNPLFQREES